MREMMRKATRKMEGEEGRAAQYLYCAALVDTY
jgi:hypothetical protein